jgi:imidazolonepropionase-like amidohydrolase
MENTMKKLIIHGTLIDGCGNKPIEDSSIIIEDGKITYVGEYRDELVNGACEVIDASGKYIIPGLIESHGRLKDDYDLPNVLKGFLKCGVTTVAGLMGGSKCLEFKNSISIEKRSEYPDMLLGRVVSGTNCHIKDYSPLNSDGPWEVRRTVRDYAQEHIDFIKTTASGGFWKKDNEYLKKDYTREELFALADEAHAWNLHCSVHCHINPGLVNSIDAGIDQIHNGVYIDEKTCEKMAEKGTFYVPALRLTSWENISAYSEDSWKYKELVELNDIHRKAVMNARKAGVRVMVGTNYSFPSPKWTPGVITLYEMTELQKCGFTPLEVIRAATLNSAAGYGIDHKTGSIEAGKNADLLILNKSPLEDIGVLSEPGALHKIFKYGEEVR